MLLDRARRHYEQRGFQVDVAPTEVRADLLVRRHGAGRLVRVDEDPLGMYQIGSLAAEAKRARLLATVICPTTPDVLESCEQFGVEHLSPEGLGEETPILAALPRREEPPLKAVASEAAGASISGQSVPLWRWLIVGVIWLCAVAAWTVLLFRLF